jgi:hypothetical protein
MTKALVRPGEKRFTGVGLLEPTFLSSTHRRLI